MREEASTSIFFLLFSISACDLPVVYTEEATLEREIRKELLFSFSLLPPSCNFLLLSKYPKYRGKSPAALLTLVLKPSFKKEQQN